MSAPGRRARFLREQRRRLVARLLPTLAILAIGTGGLAIVDLVRPSPRGVILGEGLTASALGALALASGLVPRIRVALPLVAVLGAAIFDLGWSAVVALTGGATSAYAFVIPLGTTALVLALPLAPRLLVVVALLGGLASLSAPPESLGVFVLLAGGGFALGAGRRRRSLLAFRRAERLEATLARLQRGQDHLVMVAKLEALRVLVGGMAHEINNALAISFASTDKLVATAERSDPAAIIKHAQRAQGGLVRIRATIDRLRRFAMGQESLRERAHVTALLDFALESAIGRLRSGVVVERDYEDNLVVECQVSALAEALFQVAKNAIESMPKGGTVRVSARRAGERVVLAVADEGSGIPPSRLAKVFDPFYARDSVDTLSQARVLPPLSGRSGLGLSTVYGLVAMMGGKVEIESEVGKGTVVSIILPVARVSPS